jgi:germination protein M
MYMQKRPAILFTILAIILCTGCARQQPTPPGPPLLSENVQLFYGDEGNERIVSEERLIQYHEGDDKYLAVLEELIRGPITAGYQANIHPDTKVYGTIQQDSDLIINLSEEFLQFAGSMAEIVAVGSIVNTITQFEIDRVKILVEGNELIAPSGEPYGFMNPFNNDPD